MVVNQSHALCARRLEETLPEPPFAGIPLAWCSAAVVAQVDRDQQLGVDGQGGGDHPGELALIAATVAPRIELHDASVPQERHERLALCRPMAERDPHGGATVGGPALVGECLGQQRSVVRRKPHEQRRSVGQQLGRVAQRPIGFDHHQGSCAHVVAGIGDGDRPQVGKLETNVRGKRQRPHDHRQVEAHGGKADGGRPGEALATFANLPGGASPEHDCRTLAHDVPGGRELLAQTVVGRVGDGRVREVRAEVAVMPGRAHRQGLVAEALLEQLVEVEGGELEPGHVAIGSRVVGPQHPAAAVTLKAPELSLVDPGAGEQVRKQGGSVVASGRPRAPRVGDVGQQVLPGGDLIGRKVDERVG